MSVMQVAYMNTKLELLNCNANMYFNKKCLEQNLTPKYAQHNYIQCNPIIWRKLL
jgi:hypothetical protein